MNMRDEAIIDWLKQEFSDDDLSNWVCKCVTETIASGSQNYGITPTIVVLEVRKNHSEPHPLHVFEIPKESFNDFHYRMNAVYKLGKSCEKKQIKAIAAFFCSEAWHRTFTKEELAERNGRLIEDYDDKQECAIVIGMTMDHRTAHARINIERDTQSRIQFGAIALLPVESVSGSADSQLLTNFWLGFYVGLSRSKPKGFG